MGRKSDLTSGQKQQIAVLLKAKNLSYADIARTVGISKASVVNVAKKLKNTNNVLAVTSNNRQNCRRERITSTRQDRKIVQTVLWNRNASSRMILREVQESGVNISERTLRRRLYENGLFCRRPAKKPKLTPCMRNRRKLWAQLHRDFDAEYWKKIIFSDECRLEAVTKTANFVRRRAGERYSEDCVLPRVIHPALSVMDWGCITSEGPGPLHFVEGTMRSVQYVEVLENVLLPYLETLKCPRDEYTFMQDGAPCHTSRMSMNCLNSMEIMVLPWPGNSPDLNPIENCWAYLKSAVYQRNNTTIQQLKENIEDVWYNDQNLKTKITQCVASMPQRIAAVLTARGGATKY